MSDYLEWSSETIIRIQNIKGVFFVTVMAFVIYAITFRDYKKLASKEKQYKDLFFSNPAPMLIFEVDTLKIIEVNNAVVHNYGYTLDEFSHMSLLDIRPEGEEKNVREAVNEEGEELEDKGLWLHKKKDGTLFWVHVFSHRTEYKGNNARLALMLDVHESVVNQNRINEQNLQLRRINWFQSHQLRSPVAHIMGLADLINYSEPSDPANREIIARILKATKDLDEVVREISSQTYSAYNLQEEPKA